MPSFSDLLAREVEAKRAFIESLFKCRLSTVKKALDAKLRDLWVSNPRAAELRDLKLIAVDAGVYKRIYSNGVAVFIARGAAVTSDGNEYRALRLDLSPAVRGRQIPSYLEFLGELAEYSAALSALRQEGGADLILLDGSLHGRLLHTPVSLGIGSEPALYIDLMSSYYELVKEAERAKCLVVGVSKDSTAMLLKRKLIEELTPSLLAQLDGKLVSEALNVLRLLKEERALSIARGRALLKALPPDRAALFEELYEEYLHGETDFSLICRNASQGDLSEGFSTPMLLGCTSSRIRRFVEEASRLGLENLVEQTWGGAIVSAPGREAQALLKESSQKLRGAFDGIPLVLSFYVLPNRLDLPIRVEYFLPGAGGFFKTYGAEFASSDAPFISEVLSAVSSGYGGPGLYNAWLVAAHKLSKMSKRAFDVYERQIFEQCGLEVLRMRRSWLE